MWLIRLRSSFVERNFSAVMYGYIEKRQNCNSFHVSINYDEDCS